MSCKYTYNGVEYTKDELINYLLDNVYNEKSFSDTYKSIKTAAKAAAVKRNIVSDTRTMLYQRLEDARNMQKALDTNPNLNADEKLKKKVYYKRVIEDIQESLGGLKKYTTAKKQLDNIFNMALADAKLVESIYSNPTSDITFGDLKLANSIVETWINIKKPLGIASLESLKEDTEDQKQVKETLKEILSKYGFLQERTRGIAIELIHQSQNGPEISKKDITQLVDTTFITEWVRDLSTTGVPIANKLSYILEETNFKINKERNDYQADINKQEAKIKNHPEIKANGYKIFTKYQKDKYGNDILALVHPYSQKFWDAKRNNGKKLKLVLKAANGDKAKIKQAWADYHKWNETNTIAFNALPFINSSKYTDSQREAEIKNIKALGITDKEVTNIITFYQKGYKKFLSDVMAKEVEIRMDVAEDASILPQGVDVEQYVQDRLTEYKELNDPLKYMDQKFYGTNGIVTAVGGAKYMYLLPVKNLNGGPSGYYDENFAKIAADPVLSEFYDWFSGFLNNSLKWFPQDEVDDLQSNFLPVIADRLAREYGLSNLKESVKGLGDWFMNALTDVNFEQKIETNPFSNKERRKIAPKFLNESIPVAERSNDLVLIARMFSDMAMVYKHKNTVSAEVDVINDMIQSAEGSYKLNRKLNTLEPLQKDAKHIKTLSDATIRSAFYGIRTKQDIDLMDSGTLYYDYKELLSLGLWKSPKAKKAKEIEDQIQNLNEQLENPDYDETKKKEISNKIDTLKTEYYKLGGRKFSMAKAIDSSIGATRLVSLGFSPLSAIRNLLVGKLNNYIHSGSGRDFTKQELTWANKLLGSSAAKYWSGGKIENRNTRLLAKIMLDSGINEGEDSIYLKQIVDKKSSIDTLREALPKAYTWLQSGDYHFKAETVLSAMKFTKVKTSKGDVSLWDVLNEDGTYNESEYGPWDGTGNGSESFDKFYTANMLKYKQLAKKLHGASGRNTYIQAKDSAIGRVLMLFKSWLPETVGVRFDPRHRDALLNRDEEGYYRTFATVLQEKKLGIFKLMFDNLLSRDLDLSDELQIANFKKAMKEIQVLLSLMMAYALLKALAPDDDDEDKKMYNLLVLRQMRDLKRDMTYYMSPTSIAELQENTFPIIGTFIKWGDAIKGFSYYTLGVENEDGDLMYDFERASLKVTKVLPILSNINRFKYYMENLD